MAKKASLTHHANKRVEQRYGGSEEALVLVRQASHYGILIHQIPKDTELYWYIDSKANVQDKKVKILNGYVFIFTKTSDKLITMYPIPEQFLPEYEAIRGVEATNKEAFKRKREMHKQQ